MRHFGDDCSAGRRRTPLLDSLVVDLERLIAVLAPAEVVGPADAVVHELAYDARAVRPGSLFFCVPGLRVDGHDFAPEAVALRCQAVLEALRGRFDAARRMLASARRTVEHLGLTHRRLETEVAAGMVELLDGKPVRALA